MNRNYVLVLFLMTAVFAIACGSAANTNTNTNTTKNSAINANVAAVNSNTNTAPLSIEDKIKAASNRAQSERNQLMANSQERGNQSLERHKKDADKLNDELKQKIEELKNSNR